MGVYIKGVTKEEVMEVINYFANSLWDKDIIELKTPHGRLIDARKWHKRLQKQAMALYGSDNRTYGLIMDIMDAIHTEPTVIEAEVE